ncbi:MAG: nucleotidyltransferase family protein [Candidatus Poribacteria bacterium]
MQNESLILSFLKENKETFEREFHITKIGLFGSYARGEATEESDIDLLVEFDSEADIFETKLKIKDFIKKSSGRTLIYVAKNISNPILKMKF